MKKIGLLILAIVLLSGCSSKQIDKTFMITRNKELYALYNQDGDQLTSYQYKTFEEIEGIGYIVTNSDDQKGFISLEGKEIIPFGKYETLEATDQMLYATKAVKEEKEDEKKKNKESKDNKDKEKEEKETTTFVNENLYVLNKDGEILYSANKDVGIYKSDLPIIYTHNEYIVLYKNGEELVKGKDEITYAQRYNQLSYLIVGYKDQSILYEFKDEESEPTKTSIESKGQFRITAVDENLNKGIVLYDENNSQMVYVNLETHKLDQKTIKATQIYYDENNNIVIENEKKIFIYTPGHSIVEMDSYYLSGETYLAPSQSVYGPHEIYKDGKKVGELKECQIYPSPELLSSEIFPVYVQDKGFEYYNFDRKKVIDKVYLTAEPFDVNARAIVKIDEKGYSLIDDKGQVITKDQYADIKYIGSSYYAVYNKDGKFGIIDTDGQEVFPVEYTTLPEQSLVAYEEKNYMILGKNGRSHVYDIEDSMNEIFSIEGEVVLDEKGYFIVGNEYYTFEGERME